MLMAFKVYIYINIFLSLILRIQSYKIIILYQKKYLINIKKVYLYLKKILENINLQINL